MPAEIGRTKFRVKPKNENKIQRAGAKIEGVPKPESRLLIFLGPFQIVEENLRFPIHKHANFRQVDIDILLLLQLPLRRLKISKKFRKQ